MKSFRLRAGGFLAALVLIAIALLAGPTYEAKAVVIEAPTSTPSGTPAVNVNCVAGCGQNSQGTIDVNLVSPNPLNVTVLNTPAPSSVPTIPASPPATLPQNFSLTGCVAIATPTPGPGAMVVDQCNANGHKIVGIESTTTLSLSGLQSPAPTPTPTAPPNQLGVQAIAHAYVGSNLIEAMVQCLTAPIHTDINSAADTTVIAGSGTTRVYLCGSRQSASGTNTGYLEYSTSATCASGFTQIDDTFDFIANNGFVDHMQYAYFAAPAGDSLCYHSGSTGQLRITTYAIQF